MCECLEPCLSALSEAFCAGAGSQYSKKNDDYGRRRAAARTLIATVLPYQLEPNQFNPAFSGLNYRRNYLQGLPQARPYNAPAQYGQQRFTSDGRHLAPSSLSSMLLTQSSTAPSLPFVSTNPDGYITLPDSRSSDIEAQHHHAHSDYDCQSMNITVGFPEPSPETGTWVSEQATVAESSSPTKASTLQTQQATESEAEVDPSAEEKSVAGVNHWGDPLVVARPLQPAAVIKQQPVSRQPSKALQAACPKHVEAAFGELMFGQIIGEGGFGKVYYGSWRGQTCAIKLMNYDAGMRSNVVEEFRREVTTMSSLTPHPNILRLIGACTKPPTLALVTEYCPRGSLYAMLHSPTTYLSWSTIVYMCLGAAHGMAHLHANRILHRDLKSGNLLVDHHFNVKVADFGLSKFYLDMQTMTGGLGTYQWMAPEVLANQRYSEKADVYSFGIVLWECSARQVPYAGMNGLQAALAVMNKGHRPEIPRHTPRSLAELISLCWAPIPEQRPSFVEVIARLERFAEELRQISETGDFPDS